MPRDGSNIYHRPAGTDGVPNFPIESSKYNAYVADVEQDLNLPRPIVAGGTGANNARDAMTTLHGDIAYQIITNYDSDPFVSGSFYSAVGATNAPVAGHAFVGICYTSDPAVVPPAVPAGANMVVEARDQNDTTVPGRVYVREKKSSVWGAWTVQAGSVADLDAAYVNVTGDTMTGPLTMQHATNPAILLNATAAGSSNDITGQKSAKGRWLMRLGDTITESGSNAGSDFQIYRFNDAGVAIDAALNITRSTSAMSTSGSLTVANSITASGTSLTVGGGGGAGTVFFGNSGARFLNWDGTNFNMQTGGTNFLADCSIWSRNTATTGVYQFGNSGAKNLLFDGTNFNFNGGSLVIAGNSLFVTNITASGAVVGSQSVQASGTNPAHGFIVNGNTGAGTVGDPFQAVTMSCAPGSFALTQRGIHIAGVWAGWTIDASGAGTFQFRNDGNAYKTGASTTWIIISDERIKTVNSEYTDGLDAIAALRPVRFVYNGKGALSAPVANTKTSPEEAAMAAKVADREYVGLVAQEAETALPDCFQTGIGFIDGKEVSDFRTAEYTPLIFALVNAVKELKARVEVLEAK